MIFLLTKRKRARNNHYKLNLFLHESVVYGFDVHILEQFVFERILSPQKTQKKEDVCAYFRLKLDRIGKGYGGSGSAR